MEPAERAAPPPSMIPHVVAPIVDASYDLTPESLVLKQGLACIEHFVRLRALYCALQRAPLGALTGAHSRRNVALPERRHDDTPTLHCSPTMP